MLTLRKQEPKLHTYSVFEHVKIIYDYIHKNTQRRMFFTALLRIAPNWKQLKMSTNKKTVAYSQIRI